MRINTASARNIARTHKGAPAARVSPMEALRRSVCSAFLWESEFYEDGEEIAGRVVRLSQDIPLEDLIALAIELRETHKLRHMPLLLLSVIARRGSGNMAVSEAIARIIRRPDEMGELLAIHARLNGVGPDRLKREISAQLKKGLATAFCRFDAYQLGKYNRDGAIRLRDVMFLTHPAPRDEAQAAVWKSLIDGTLAPPDTWEVALSTGADKRETFERLIRDGRLGYLALLRNLRGMMEAGVDDALVRDAILARRGAGNVLPFRYVAAARACPMMEPALDEALSEAVLETPILEGKTIILVDVSGSMGARLSARSDLTRMDAAATLASIIHGDLRVFTFSRDVVEVAPRRGMAGVDAIVRSQPHLSTCLGDAVRKANATPHDRLIVITDEQARGNVPAPVSGRAYMINVASVFSDIEHEGSATSQMTSWGKRRLGVARP